MSATKKNKKSSTKKKILKRESIVAKFFENNLGRICLIIAIFDLAHALFFVLQATISLVTSFNLYTSLALLGTIFWVLIVILLIVGLSKRRPVLVKAWLIFSIAGFIADTLFLIWGIVSSVSIDWDHLREFSIIFIGIFIESLCIYLVYRYYLVMDPCRIVYEPEKGSKRQRKKYLNAKECRESQRSARKSSKKSEKSKKNKPVKKKK
ncbi:uncharacterized protein LOC132789911 [Drosophila nasuta]|uniref:Uncharacterized protein LOC117568499 n=1 Tax=Drosophila albomicans TaxID=7291 RepID=A0A6P8YAJ0_DROAB|nr:uncharacterized protein LOC117568499 [Drosophila albomicans]XP_060654227.1 uncharacterized protein LOC132789911 [Drosophila nasuta]